MQNEKKRRPSTSGRPRSRKNQTQDGTAGPQDVHARPHDARSGDPRQELLADCGEIAEAPDVLEVFDGALRQLGVVGSTAPFRLLYLALTTRLLAKQVSVGVKAQSAAGKSFAVDTVLKFMPDDAYVRLSAQSEKAIVYSKRELAHRFLVIGEAEGLGSDLTKSLIRQLLSEGQLDYEYTVFDEGREPHTEWIKREGPTGLIVTTTRPRLDPELETRLLSTSIDDSPAQTKAIFRAAALEDELRPEVDLATWEAFQESLALGARGVEVPFAQALANLIPPAAVRMRRDFPNTLRFVRASALLHQETRDHAEDGRVIATVEGDYAPVRELVEPLVAEGVERRVSETVRETVDTVVELHSEAADYNKANNDEERDAGYVSVPQLARVLKLDQATIRRRVYQALQAGYIDDLSGGGRGRPKKLVPAEAMPGDDEHLLPTPEDLELAWMRSRTDRESSL
jgi:hypothetical protein